MKKNLTLILVLFLALSVLAGCQQAATPTNTPAATTTPEPTKVPPQTITFAHVQGEWSWPALDAIIADYKTRSSNTVELVYVPAADMATWSKTQYTGGTASDIIWSSGQPASEYYKNGWIIDLKAAYDAVSPYTGKAWKDSFRTGVLDGVVDALQGNAMLGMPTGVVSVNLFYNKTIFKDLGLADTAPMTWSDVLATAKKVKDSGKDLVPYSVQNSMGWNLGWQEYFMMEQLWFDVVKKLDIITPNGKLDVSEQALGVKSGIIDPGSQRMVDYFKFMQEFAQYFNKGFNTASWEYEKLFNEGKSAMNLNGSWFPNQVLSSGITVDYGIGPMPYVDSAISSFAENRQRKYSIGMGGNDVVVSKTAVDGGRGDTAIDFLRYLSDPSTGAKLVTEKFMFIPVVKDVAVPEVMKGITDFIGDDTQQVGWAVNNFTPEENDKYRTMFAGFLEGSMTPEKMAADFKTLALAACDQAIADHPEWKVDEFISKVK